MDEQSALLPSFDDYVTARGGDLLRTAWLLTGDRQRAEDLVRTALAAVLPHWRRIAAQEAGHHDADVRRTMMATYATRRRRGPDHDRPSEPVAGDPGGGEDAAVRDDVLAALARLPRAQRAVVVLLYFEDLGESQAAEALDSSVGTVRALGQRALAALPPTLAAPGSGPLDPQWRLRDALQGAAPSSPDVDGLAEGARRSAARSRRRRRTAGASLAAGTLVAVGTLALATGPNLPLLPDPEPSPTTSSPPSLPFQYCQLPAVAAAPAGSDGRSMSERYDAALVCARTDGDSVWSGSLPPDDVLTEPPALDLLRVAARDDGATCPPSLPRGPAFRLLLRTHDGTVEYLPNEALRCDGWEALSSYFVAVAEQRGDTAEDPRDGSYLACPPAWKTSAGTAPSSLPRGTVFATATICLHPLVEVTPTAAPVFRGMRGNVLGDLQVAPINGELADHGTVRARPRACAQKLWRYVLRAVTSEGEVVELASSCPEQLELVGAPGTVLRLGPEVASLLRGSVLGS